MPTTYEIADIPADEVERVMAEQVGATKVTKVKQNNGKYTVRATYPDGDEPSPPDGGAPSSAAVLAAVNESGAAQLRNSLREVTNHLLDERNAAAAAGEPAKVKTAEEEVDRIFAILAAIQNVMNARVALKPDAIAKSLSASIKAQRAVGLSSASAMLEKIVDGFGAGKRTASPAPSKPASPPAKADASTDVMSQLIAGAKAANLDPILVLTIVAIESDFNPAAASPLSSGGGLFQFLDETWIAEGGPKAGPGGKGHGFAAGAPVDVQVKIGCAFIAKQVAALRKKTGSEPSAVAIYMAHQQGLAGAVKILQADPDSAIESVIGESAARNNRLGGLSVRQAIAKFNVMVRAHEDEVRALMKRHAAEGGAIFVNAPAPLGAFAARAAHVALAEMERFARKGGAVVRETEEPLKSRVLEYFRLVGRPDIRDPKAEPWSAAFISFVMNTAGALPTEFPVSQNHARYILLGLANRMANRENATVVYFDRDEMAPRIGDLIGFSRTSEVRSRGDLEKRLPDTFFPSHTDLVIDTSPGKLKIIGGNVSQTITTGTVKLDGRGMIDEDDKHFFVLRLNLK